MLDRLSDATGGSRFQAYFDAKAKGVRWVDRADPAAGTPWKDLAHDDPHMSVLAKVPGLFSQQTAYMW